MAKMASGSVADTNRLPDASSRATAMSLARWGSLAALLAVCIALGVFWSMWMRSGPSARKDVALVAEVCDQHIATMAAGLSPQVVSTDRHTVKPWFQGKLPFSFNLPGELPAGMTLDGANLTYLGSEPTAQLLYSIGKHRASVFVREAPVAGGGQPVAAERSGFHVDGFTTGHLQVLAVSDADPARLRDLVSALRSAQ
jgi:anti-sigma factor RsiW